MQDEDRQTQEAFDAVTGEAMALTPPRVEDQALVPRSQAGRGLDPVEFARPSFESALERFRSAGQVDVNPDDPALFNAYRRSLDYLGDMALGGLDLTDAAFRAAVGITAQALPENQERSFARDLAAMPEAFMGYSPGRIQAATDRVAEGVSEVGRRLNQPGPMPTVLGSNFGNVAAGSPSPRRGPASVPRFTVRGENTTLPSPTFGSMKLRDLFEEDQWENRLDLDFTAEDEGIIGEMPLFVNPDNGNTFGTGPEFNLGYAPNIRVHDLADIVLGRRSVEETLEYFGEDPDPHLVDYVNKRISNLQERPKFQEYVERYRVLNEPYDPYNILNPSPSDWDVAGESNTVATFRSPIPDVLNQIEFPSAGIKGSQLLKALQDSPSVRGSELRSLGVNIDPQRRYSEEEARGLFEGKLWTATASLQESPRYEGYQRQKVLGPIVDYFELTVNANRSNAPSFRSLRSQHFDDDTLAHTRASVREDRRGEYILPEEFQSDLLQQGFIPSTQNIKQALADKLSSDLNYTPDIDWPDYIAESNFTEILGNSLNGLGRATDFEGGDTEFYNIWNALDDTLDPATYKEFVYDAANATAHNLPLPDIREYFVSKNYAEPPIQKTVEGVRLAFDGLLAEAQRRGIDRIIIPPFERIVAERFRPGSEEYFKALEPTSGFYATYKKGLEQVLKEYERELGRENFNTNLIDMDYEPVTYIERGDILDELVDIFSPRDPERRRVVELPITGTEVNFKGALDAGYDFSSPRFAEGGLVQNYNSGGVVSMEEQMSLFEMGGLADDGAMRDPVSGNEVPPGSLANEVRDDVPAMLSEGEYIVPADVVRYYGVKFFEDLRMGAKTGLSNMERDGRIGGEPVGATAEDDLTPEELQMLAEISGMYAGGDVRKPQKDIMSIEEVLSSNESIYDIINSPTTVYLGDGSIATSPEMKRDMFRRIGLIQIADASGMYGGGMVRRGYQEGGLNDTGFTPIPNYTIPGFSAFQPVQAPTVEEPKVEDKPVVLYGPNNEPITLMLPRDQSQYDTLLAQGYTKTAKTPNQTQQFQQDNGRDDTEDFVFGGGDRESSPLNPEMFEALNSDPLAYGQSMLEKKDYSRIAGGAGTALLGPAGGLFAGAVAAGITANNVAQAKAAVEIAKSQGLDTTTLEQNITNYVNSLPNAARIMAETVTGDNIVDRYKTQLGQTAPTTPAPVAPAVPNVPIQPVADTGTTKPPVSDAGLSKAASMTEEEKTAGREYAERGSDRDTSWEGGQVGITAADREESKSVQEGATAAGKDYGGRDFSSMGSSYSGKGYTSGRATGGLVARPSRKK